MINPPKVLHAPEARFSEEARQKRISGQCLVSLTIDATGMPLEPKIIRCTDSSLEATSLDAASQYRFKPATTLDDKPTTAKIQIEIDYHTYGTSDPELPIRHPELQILHPELPIHYTISTPPGISSSDPGPDGVYPLTSLSTPPSIIMFSDAGYQKVTSSSTSLTACDIVLTVSAKGKHNNAQVIYCERVSLEKPALQSLLKYRYKPGSVDGKAVPMRVSIRLECGNTPPKP
jgi:TonB family protein